MNEMRSLSKLVLILIVDIFEQKTSLLDEKHLCLLKKLNINLDLIHFSNILGTVKVR